ncbi:MAG: SDR family oxidoreductase [Acidimicrobiales bacterium]|jgi:NAD(P)-dependent dehydrogenase (short-subunit alcohol dehydrogenase family)
MDLGFTDATAVVTGGTKGMGRAIAECLATEGARVAVLARGRPGLDRTVSALEALGSPEALGVEADVSRAADVEAAFSSVEQHWGSLNVLVNTVGPAAGRFENLGDDDWIAAFELGTMAAVRCVRGALGMLRRAQWARIVNLSAHSTQRQSEILPAYTASKAALTSVSKNLARSLAPDGILVNTVSPGTIVTASFTEALRGVFEQRGLDASDPHDVMRWIDEVFHQPADLGRAGLPEDVATVVVFLASRRNAYVTGANVNVDGGSDFV